MPLLQRILVLVVGVIIEGGHERAVGSRRRELDLVGGATRQSFVAFVLRSAGGAQGRARIRTAGGSSRRRGGFVIFLQRQYHALSMDSIFKSGSKEE